jgi:RNA polymerase-binding transcription factor DksA
MNNAAAVLRGKQRELLADLARLKSEARASGGPEVRDSTDAVMASQSSGEAMEEVTLESRTLERVEDALKRVADGTYGTCAICGRTIAPGRLEAIPWTPYCLEDQEKLDK